MPFYMRLGELPPKRHIQFKRDPKTSFKGEGLAYEHVITTAGFDRAYSIRYHLRPPTRVKNVEVAGQLPLERAGELPLRHHHLRSKDLPRSGDLIRGRVPLFFNPDMACYRCRPAQAQAALYRNAGADEVIFIFGGGGALESPYGRVSYRENDYVVIPRGTTYQLVPKDPAKEDYLILESNSAVRIPERYLNPDGQIRMGAPYYHRDFHGPAELITLDRDEETEIFVKDGARLTRVVAELGEPAVDQLLAVLGRDEPVDLVGRGVAGDAEVGEERAVAVGEDDSLALSAYQRPAWTRHAARKAAGSRTWAPR